MHMLLCIMSLWYISYHDGKVITENKTVHLLFVDDHGSDSFGNLEKYFTAKLKSRLLTFNFAVAIGWWIDGFCNFVTVLFISLIFWSFKMHIGLRNPDSKVHGANMGPTGPRWAPCLPHELCCLGIFVLAINTLKLPPTQCLVYNVPGGLPVYVWFSSYVWIWATKAGYKDTPLHRDLS